MSPILLYPHLKTGWAWIGIMTEETPGYIYLKRKIQDNWLWLSEPFTKAQAWVDLILLANYEESAYYLRGNLIKIRRGELGRSEVSLCDRWKWSKNKVRSFLNTLESEQQIQIERSQIINKIFLINYEQHQDLSQQKVQQKDYRLNDRRTTEGTHIKESIRKNEVIIKEEVIDTENLLPVFIPEDLWKAFLQIRAKNRSRPFTPTAQKLAINKLIKFHQQGFDVREIMEYTIEAGYPSFYEPKGKQHDKGTGKASPRQSIGAQIAERRFRD